METCRFVGVKAQRLSVASVAEVRGTETKCANTRRRRGSRARKHAGSEERKCRSTK